MRLRGHGEQTERWRRPHREPDAVSGCLMLIARDVFERIGLLDERYFFGFEEIDFCLRAHEAGFSTHLVPDALAYHEGGQSMGAFSTRRLYFAARNHLMLSGLLRPPESRVTRAARIVSVTMLNLVHAAKARGGTLPTRVWATSRGVIDYLGGRSGPDPTA